MNKPRYLTGKEQDRMISNGWGLELAKDYNESPEDMHNRLSKRYDNVKIYWDTTTIRGLHEYYAMCK